MGHNVGDELLQRVSERLSLFLSEKALFARVGGDEFKIFIEDFENIKYIEELADNLLKQFEKLFVCGDYEINTTVSTGKIVGAEALIRWNSATLGFVRPDQFIGVAEDTHMIIEIGKWVLNKACEDFVKLKREGYELGQVSINISAVQLRFSDLFDTLQDVIKSTGIDTKELEVISLQMR